MKSPAIIRAETVEEVARHTIRWTSLGILLISFIGAIMAFNGSWPTSWQFWHEISITAVVAGIILQSFCTLMEWANHKRKGSPQYLAPLILDIASTYVGFTPLLIPIFEKALLHATLPTLAAQIIAHIGVVILAWWVAYYPEQNLIEE